MVLLPIKYYERREKQIHSVVESVLNRIIFADSMSHLLAKVDWFRILIMASCSGYLFNQIYIKTDSLLKREIGFIETTADSDEMKFPSITFCPVATDESIEVGNITADYESLSKIEDIILGLTQPIRINK